MMHRLWFIALLSIKTVSHWKEGDFVESKLASALARCESIVVPTVFRLGRTERWKAVANCANEKWVRDQNGWTMRSCIKIVPLWTAGGGILWNDLWHLPRWSVILFGGVMSHAELLRRCCVTVVWFTLRWLIALLGVHTSGANRSPPSHPWYSRSSLPQSCLYPPLFSLPLRIDWCLVTVLGRRVETQRLPLEDEVNTVKESH